MSKRPVIYYAVTQERGENWDEHARFMEALVDDGFVVLSGPLDGGEKVLLIINAESRQAIEARLVDDPWTPMEVRCIAKVERT